MPTDRKAQVSDTPREATRSRAAVRLGAVVLLWSAVLALAATAQAATDWDTVTIDIARHPAEVFPYMTEPEKQRQWIEGLETAQPFTKGGWQVGSRAREAIFVEGGRYEVESEVLVMEPGRAVEIRYSGRRLVLTARYEFEGVPAGTRVTMKSRSDFKTWTTALLAPFINSSIRKKTETDLQSLKTLLEGSKPRVPALPVSAIRPRAVLAPAGPVPLLNTPRKPAALGATPPRP